jgi:hypothetical protein
MNLLTANKRKAVTRYDFETLDWAARVVTAGGTVSQTTKDAVQTFVANMKSVGSSGTPLWGLCQEIGIFAGSNLAAALVKLKYVSASTLTNNNFVSGDYAETGGSGGLLGNGTTKYLDTGYNINTSLPATMHFSFYLRENITGAQCAMIGAGDAGNTNQFMLYSNAPGTDITARLGQLQGRPATREARRGSCWRAG